MGKEKKWLELSPCCLADVETHDGGPVSWTTECPPDPVRVCSQCEGYCDDVYTVTERGAQALRQPRRSNGRFCQ